MLPDEVRKAGMLFDPLGLVLDVFNDLYPGKPATVTWRQGMKESGECYGCTDFDHDPPLVSVDVDLPVTGAIDVLAHELAHVAAGHVKPAHGKAWKDAFNAIHTEYMERVAAMETAHDNHITAHLSENSRD
jgi:hypothetical protein